MAVSSQPLSAVIAILLDYVLILIGVILLWRLVIRPRERPAPALAAWDVRAPDFLMYVLVIIIAGLSASFAAGLLLTLTHLSPDNKTIIASAAFQLGLLTGPALLPLGFGHPPLRPPLDRATWISGLGTFLIAMPVVTLASLLWPELLKLCHLPADQQDILRMFLAADSNAILALLVVLAVLVAPISEELLFRGVFFRYLRTRVPKWVAVLAPAAFFAALHVTWSTLDGLASFVPLVALAVVFSLAYERTGRIGTVIVAHALFNLHTVLQIFAGVTQ